MKERGVSIAFGLSIITWALLGYTKEFSGNNYPVVRVGISLLHSRVGCLFIFRTPLRLNPGVQQGAVVLFSFICCAISFKLAALTSQWPIFAVILWV